MQAHAHLQRCGYRTASLLLAVAASLLVACGSSSAPASATVTPHPTATALPSFHAVIAPTADGLAALDPATGQQIWSATLGGAITAYSPAVAGGAIVVPLAVNSPGKLPATRVVALDVKTGTSLWHKDLGENTQGFVFASGETLIQSTSAVSVEAPNVPKGVTLAALKPSDGSVIWQHTLPDSGQLSPVFVSGGAVSVITGTFAENTGATTATLSTFTSATGAQLWQKSLGTSNVVAIVAGDGAIYVSMSPRQIPVLRMAQQSIQPATVQDSAGMTLTAFSTSTGAQLWRNAVFATKLAEANGRLYATVMGPQGMGLPPLFAVAYAAASGATLWQTDQLGATDITNYQGPSLTTNKHAVFVFNMPEDQPGVYACNGGTGSQLWKTPLMESVVGSVAGEQLLYVATVSGYGSHHQYTLRAYATTTGSQAWAIPAVGGSFVVLV